MERFDGAQLPNAPLIWKRNVAVFAPGGTGITWTEGTPAADGSITYTPSAAGGTLTCEWESGKKETDKNLGAGAVITYWPDTGKVKIKD